MNITLETAIQLLRSGEVIAIPTDTVYGLAADMHNPDAVDKIFTIKKRPNDRPLIILVHDIDQIIPFVESFPPHFYELATHFWPGALTLVIPIKSNTIHPTIRAGLATAGFRIPAHPVTLKLLQSVGPVVAPSANISNQPTSITPTQIEQYFGSDFPILKSEKSPQGIESTILCFDKNEWKITRQGAIIQEKIDEILHK